MKYTLDNNNIMHEIGHLLLFTLYLSSRKKLTEEYFTSKFISISIIEDENSYARCTLNNKFCADKFVATMVFLSGVLFSLEYVENSVLEFDSRKQIKKKFIEVFNENGGINDLLWVLRNIRIADSSYITSFIIELKKIIQILRYNDSIKKIIHKTYRRLQKDKYLSNRSMYCILKPHVEELTKLGHQIYNPLNRLRTFRQNFFCKGCHNTS